MSRALPEKASRYRYFHYFQNGQIYINTLKRDAHSNMKINKYIGVGGGLELAIPFVPLGKWAFPRAIWPLRTCNEMQQIKQLLKNQTYGSSYIYKHMHARLQRRKQGTKAF